jgi:hypothetical protein
MRVRPSYQTENTLSPPILCYSSSTPSGNVDEEQRRKSGNPATIHRGTTPQTPIDDTHDPHALLLARIALKQDSHVRRITGSPVKHEPVSRPPPDRVHDTRSCAVYPPARRRTSSTRSAWGRSMLLLKHCAREGWRAARKASCRRAWRRRARGSSRGGRLRLGGCSGPWGSWRRGRKDVGGLVVWRLLRWTRDRKGRGSIDSVFRSFLEWNRPVSAPVYTRPRRPRRPREAAET